MKLQKAVIVKKIEERRREPSTWPSGYDIFKAVNSNSWYFKIRQIALKKTTEMFSDEEQNTRNLCIHSVINK